MLLMLFGLLMDLLIRGIDLQYVVGEFNRGDISYGICIYIYINSLLLNEV